MTASLEKDESLTRTQLGGNTVSIAITNGWNRHSRLLLANNIQYSNPKMAEEDWTERQRLRGKRPRRNSSSAAEIVQRANDYFVFVVVGNDAREPWDATVLYLSGLIGMSASGHDGFPKVAWFYACMLCLRRLCQCVRIIGVCVARATLLNNSFNLSRERY